MATVGSFITIGTILSAPRQMRPALLAAAPAHVRREVQAHFRQAWEQYVEDLHRRAKTEGRTASAYPTYAGGVVDADWWSRQRPPILDPVWTAENTWVWSR